MNTRQFLSAALVMCGIVLLLVGITAMSSFGSDLPRFFSGSPTDQSVWMFIGGIAMLVLGMAGGLKSKKS